MKLAGITKPMLLALGLVLLGACFTDPNKQKLKYLNSGERCAKVGWAYCRFGSPESAVAQFKEYVQKARNNATF
jgi:hypothetical protein